MKILNGAVLPSVPFVVCDGTGAILRVGHCPAQIVELQASNQGELVFAGALDPATQYIDLTSESIVQKQTIIPIVDGLHVTGLPVPCTAVVEGASHVITDGQATFAFDVPGTYDVLLTARNWLSTTVTLVQP